MTIKLVLEHHNPALYDTLRTQIKVSNQKIADLEYNYKFLELKYGAEIQYNNALCDLLRQNNISFPKVLDHQNRKAPKL